MKFVKIPYSDGNGFKLINLDLVEVIMVNGKSGTGIILMQSQERIPLGIHEMKTVLERISSYNFHYQHYLSLGAFESKEASDF